MLEEATTALLPLDNGEVCLLGLALNQTAAALRTACQWLTLKQLGMRNFASAQWLSVWCL